MRVVKVAKPDAPFDLVERPMPEPGPRQVRIKVEACGICHSDSYVVTGTFPGVRYPAVPGHEIAGRIDKVGSNATTWRVAQRAGAGIGGLGHLGVQFATKMGFHTVAIARGRDKEQLALDLGAHRYIDSEIEDAAVALMALGGAKTILAPVTRGKAMAPLVA